MTEYMEYVKQGFKLTDQEIKEHTLNLEVTSDEYNNDF